MPITRRSALAAGIAAALLVAGCGGSASSDKAGGANIVQKAGGADIVRAADVSSSVPGYQVTMKLTGQAAGHAINATGTGAFDQSTHAGSLKMNVSLPTLGVENLQIDVVIVGEDCYLKLPASLAAKIPGGKPWLELNLSEIGKRVGTPGLPSLGVNPAQFLQYLRAASTGSIQSLGHETIDGDGTTGLRTTVDLSKVADTLPASRRQSASSAIAMIEKLTGLHYLPIEAWVDSSDHVRRIIVSATGHVDGQPFSENIQLDFVRYGPEPVPAAPPAGEVTNIMSLSGTR
jgi:hypothetical protein